MQSIHTERLLLRPMTLDDTESVFALNSLPQVMQYLGEPNASLEQAEHYLATGPLSDYKEHGYGRHACIEKSSGTFIGFCGIKYLPEHQAVDIGYRLLPDYWGRGLALEAAKATLQYGFDVIQLEKILGIAMPENTASIKVLQNLEMRYQGSIEHLGTRCVCYSKTQR